MKRQSGFTLIELLIVVVIIGIIAAVGIPSLLRARVSANEAATIGDLRSVVSGEAMFEASANFYGTLSCLSTPSGAGCIPNYPAGSPSFLETSLTGATQRFGYNRAASYANPGPTSGLWTLYCVSAIPTNPNMTGVRSFGADKGGVVGASVGAASCCSGAVVDTTLCPIVR